MLGGSGERFLQGDSRSHEAPRFSMLLRKHKRHEVDLTESTFAEYTVVSHSIVLLVIAAAIWNEPGLWKQRIREDVHKVLDSGSNTVFLNTIHVGSGNESRKYGVF
jgi:hypothetical protein